MTGAPDEQAGAEGAPAPRLPRLRHLVVSLASFGLLTLAYAPEAWAPLIFVALVPWLVHARVAPAKGFGRAWVAGSLFFTSALMWWVSALAGSFAAGFGGWAVIVFLLFLMLLPWAPLMRRVVVSRDVPLVLGAPLVLAAQDAFRDSVMDGVTWHSPGFALADWTPMIQIADLCGVAPLSILIYATNGALAELVLRAFFDTGPTWRAVVVRLTVLAALYGAVLGYGHWRIAGLDEVLRDGPAAVGVQGNVAQEDKLREAPDFRERIYQRHVALMAEGTERLPQSVLFVWPETSFFPVDERAEAFAGERRGAPLDGTLNWTRRRAGTSVAREFAQATSQRTALEPPVYVLGFVSRDDHPEGGTRTRNSAAVVRRRDGELYGDGRYHKRQLVPFGEFLPGPPPLRDAMADVVRDAAGFVPAMTAGDESVAWPIRSDAGDHTFAVTICFEIVFPRYFTEARAAGVDFMVNLSNDAWYAGSAELALVHAQTKFRAVENRMSIFRVSNTGISTLIDPVGREVATVREDGRREDVAGVLAGRIPVGAPIPPAVTVRNGVRTVLIVLGVLLLPISAFFKQRNLGGLGKRLFT